jgi:alkaline phosphatase D
MKRSDLPHTHSGWSRRGFLRASGATIGLAGLHAIPGPRAFAGTNNLFPLGVASGDPAAESVVLWTRLAPDPLGGGGLTRTVQVQWEMADDEQFSRIVRRGSVPARAETGHSVHVTAQGLRADRWYFYRFRAEGQASRVGRTRTFPARADLAARLRFAVVSCQDYQNGYYAAYNDIIQQDLDCIVHTGDYMYEYAGNPGAIRSHTGGETEALVDYRNRYALYKLDAQLQEAHARFPFIVIWDDHEVQDNYAGLVSEYGVPTDAFRLRRAAAYQAYYENMPLRRSTRPHGERMRLYRQLHFGRLADLFMIDGRQYRTDQPCVPLAASVGVDCPGTQSPTATFLGGQQERWLTQGLQTSEARWNILAQTVLMMRGDLGAAFGSVTPYFNFDAWDGYQVQRQRLLDLLARGKAANPIVLTGDIHSAWVANLKQDFLNPASSTVGVEFVCTSITSDFPAVFVPLIEANLGPTSRNPHILYFEGRRHGYIRCDVTPALWRSDFRVVEDILSPTAPASTAASWVVENGVPGTVPA